MDVDDDEPSQWFALSAMPLEVVNQVADVLDGPDLLQLASASKPLKRALSSRTRFETSTSKCNWQLLPHSVTELTLPVDMRDAAPIMQALSRVSHVNLSAIHARVACWVADASNVFTSCSAYDFSSLPQSLRVLKLSPRHDESRCPKFAPCCSMTQLGVANQITTLLLNVMIDQSCFNTIQWPPTLVTLRVHVMLTSWVAHNHARRRMGNRIAGVNSDEILDLARLPAATLSDLSIWLECNQSVTLPVVGNLPSTSLHTLLLDFVAPSRALIALVNIDDDLPWKPILPPTLTDLTLSARLLQNPPRFSDAPISCLRILSWHKTEDEHVNLVASIFSNPAVDWLHLQSLSVPCDLDAVTRYRLKDHVAI